MRRSLLVLSIVALSNGGVAAAWVNDADQITIESAETLAAVARRTGVPLDGLVSANEHLDIRATLEKGRLLRIPNAPLEPSGPRDGLVVNLAELRVYYFVNDALANVFPIGIGRTGNDTPLADTRITRVDAEPSWRPPASIHAEYRAHGLSLPAVVLPGPDNPLGGHALRLNLPGYLLHGTNAPEGVGLRVSHGCIRLYNEHIAILAETVPVGTRVRIVNEPVKWRLDEAGLLIEAYRPLTGKRYEGAAAVSDALDGIRAAIAAKGLSVARFDTWLEERHVARDLFTGLVLTLSVEALS
ncbi:putative L,D-transpeptidase YbiS [Granulosicoccus antarcticus IMCC3135]|uniref:Putative L,D-transpeptidase YbiS n=2 Tax=Granulosicoccus TaxID=437504 RepID=A0A2Z2P0M4_9GAMM|nr:putative L,D-transpeptidase YbiS [Granulosicoccus antarcticus IMCC3135]